MKKLLLYLTCIPFVFLFISSCKKGDCFDNIPPNHFCKIEKISGDFNYVAGEQAGTFAYNQNGDPVSFKKNDIGTANPDFIFLYDNKKRLTDFIGVYTGYTSFEKWHRYKYSNNDKLITDSVYTFGEIINGNPSGYYKAEVSYVELDSKGRIKGNYDANGNIKPGDYDNKINLHRVNKVFQLIDRDYNMNNRIPPAIESYNPAGLPTGLKMDTKYGDAFLLNMPYSHLTIEYQCK